MNPNSPNSVEAFAVAAEEIAATRSRLAKVARAAVWLGGLEGDRLDLGARYLGGRVFPAWDGRTLGIGGRTLVRIIDRLTGATDDELSVAWRKYSDAGDVVNTLYRSEGSGGVDLGEVDVAMVAVAATGKAEMRVDVMHELLSRCSSLEAKYVTKLLTGEFRIGLSEGLVESAIVEAFGADPDLVSRANMLTGDLGEVARLAADRRLSEAKPRLFAPLRFMLANAVADATEVIERLGNDVWVEDKYDGIRCQLHRSGETVALYSRDLRDITGQFPEITAAIQQIPDRTILDGEVLGWKDGRVLPFSALQTRLGRVDPSAQAREAVPVVYVAWDILMEDGQATLEESLRVRRSRLEALHLSHPYALAHLEEAHDAAELDRIFTEVRARLNEGLMVKNPDSPYLPGRRGLHWLKLKRPLDTLDVVVVGAEWGYGRRRGVLSDVTFAVRADSGDLLTVGKAYTGLTDAEILEMTALLKELTVADHGRYLSVSPQIVLEIAFDAVQESKRHKSGYALRFPRIVNWRKDKSVDDIDSVGKVARLAEARAADFNQKIDQA